MIYVYDTTLRDGAQTPHLNLTLQSKLRITELLHELGIPYIEGGFAGSNPRDEAYFREVMERRRNGYLPGSKIAAFGMTAKTRNVEHDPYLHALTDTGADVYTIVGKAHKGHVSDVLRLPPQEYLAIIRDSIDRLKSTGRDVFFDAEHFFDGYKLDPDYALRALEAARNADVLVLCDTNSGSWPEEIYDITSAVRKFSSNHLGIHCHNDRELAVANSLAAVKAGVEQVQGTMNGLGERAGNTNLTSLIPNLYLMGHPVISASDLERLTPIATEVGRATGRRVPYNMPFVGPRAFYHTGGLHTDAMMKMPGSYEHMPPEMVGNKRYFVISEQAGKAAARWWADKFGLAIPEEKLPEIMKEVSRLQSFGEAQTYLLLRKSMGDSAMPFEILDGGVEDNFDSYPEAHMRIRVNGDVHHESSVGDGPVNALDMALRKAVGKVYPHIGALELVDYDPVLSAGEKGTEAKVDLSITFRCDGGEFESRATDTDIVKASKKALADAYAYYLSRH